MKFNLFMLPSLPCTFEERSRLRPIGRSREKYQEMLLRYVIGANHHQLAHIVPGSYGDQDPGHR